LSIVIWFILFHFFVASFENSCIFALGKRIFNATRIAVPRLIKGSLLANNESTMSEQVLTNIIAEYFKTQPILRAWLFGSFARGEATPESDVDILVEFDHSSPIGLFTYAQIWRELQERLGREVDLVEEGTLKPFAVKSANRDKKLVYERAN
jgi:hypothetical protein